MQRLMLIGPGQVRWEDAPEPDLASPGAAVVRPVAVATCDLDVAVLAGRYPLAGPYPFGHEAVAEVVRVGPEVAAVKPGDLVVVPFQISCGQCPPCLRGRTGNCAAHPRMSTYGLGVMGGLDWGGLLADLAVVPHADVLIVGGDSGARSIGLYAAGLAVALGAGRVAYLDTAGDRLELAAALGAEVIAGPPGRKAGSFPVTVDASGSPDGLRCALNSTAPDGTCTSVSIYLEDPALPMLAMYSRCCTLHTGRVHARPAIPAVLGLVAAGFNPALATSAVVGRADAVAALADPPMKLVLDCRAG